MSSLLDVNLLLACAWRTHLDYEKAIHWLKSQKHFATCTITEIGFLRVSMSPAYRASFDQAIAALTEITSMSSCQFVRTEVRATDLPKLTAYLSITDACLVQIAQQNGLKLATLDKSLCASDWALDIAFKPF